MDERREKGMGNMSREWSMVRGNWIPFGTLTKKQGWYTQWIDTY